MARKRSGAGRRKTSRRNDQNSLNTGSNESEEENYDEVEYVVEDLSQEALAILAGNDLDKNSLKLRFTVNINESPEPTSENANIPKKNQGIDFANQYKVRNDGNSDSDSDTPKMKLKKYSLKHRLRLKRFTIAELKSLVPQPELVDLEDCTAVDPLTLFQLRSYHNSVPVPQNWGQKRKYLQNKRGFQKPPFDLPEFIKATGIMGVRGTEDDEDTKLKSKSRERHQPKMGRMELDYQKMHDAFFKYQTKPSLSIHGDLYYEGKESEKKIDTFKVGMEAGHLSEELKDALGMESPLSPPPWLSNMQRVGPPPNYPLLKIPGVNAPIPIGAKWGLQPGGWGKPPVDDQGKPLFGDVFGLGEDPSTTMERQLLQEKLRQYANSEQRDLWGNIEEDDEEDEDNEEDSDEEEEGNDN